MAVAVLRMVDWVVDKGMSCCMRCTGEVAMLSSANSEISLRAAAVNARNTQLSVQLEGLGARLSGAEQQIQDREAALATARTKLLEKDSGLRQLEGQVAALRQQVTEAQQDGKKQDDCIRWVQRQLVVLQLACTVRCAGQRLEAAAVRCL